MPNTTPGTLNDLPVELLERIGDYLPTRDMAALATTCKTFYYLFSQKVEERFSIKLMDYVLKPTEENVKKAKSMIAANPKIMFIETVGVEWASGVEETVDDVTGETRTRIVPRIVKSSPFKAALGTGDSEIYSFMAEHFNKVVYKNEKGEVFETGNQRAQRQIKEQFPNGFAYPAVEKEFTDLMNEIVNAITTDQALNQTDTPSPATQAVLKKFRHYFLPKDVTQGHHFNLNYLMETFNLYNQNSSPWNEDQISLFWCQVIGYLERLAPAVDAQAFCQELYYRVEENQLPTRSLTLSNYQSNSNIDYFSSIPGTAGAGLGFDFGIYIYSGETGCARPTLKNYVEQKHQGLTTLNNTLNRGLTQQSEKQVNLVCNSLTKMRS